MEQSQITQEETTQQEGTATEGQSEETSTFTGTLDEVKDFMFVVTGEDGTCYEFTFDEEKPEGLDSVNVGDKVTVTYTGTASEVDPFDGEVISVEAAEGAGLGYNLVAGANIAGFKKVAAAMMAQGLV